MTDRLTLSELTAQLCQLEARLEIRIGDLPASQIIRAATRRLELADRVAVAAIRQMRGPTDCGRDAVIQAYGEYAKAIGEPSQANPAEKQMYGNKPECLCHFCTMDRVRNIVRESCPHGQVCTYCFGTKKVEQSDGSNRPCNYCNGTGCEPSTAHIGDEES